jgi:uncharacterized zinc-type alcohol dehydrogenase-like protein
MNRAIVELSRKRKSPMSLNVFGYAAQSATSPIAPFHFERRDPRPTDVVIEIKFCGVCHSDLHQARNDWFNSIYPMVPGHEIVGVVHSVGLEVSKFKVGEWVAVGCMVDSCQECGSCREGLEQYCENRATLTYNDLDRHDKLPTFGGYSQKIVVSDRFVVKLPNGLDPKAAAPLLCAGITTYSPLRHWKIGAGSKVGVVGLGGLGHMGLKFAKAFGADVTLFTRTPDKETEAKRLGADHVVLSTDEAQMNAVKGDFEFILDTVPVEHDLSPYLASLKRDGVLCLVGMLTPIDPPFWGAALMGGRKSVSGSGIGGIEETQQMLDFCAEKNIDCDIEMIDIQDINTAYERMQKSDVKYRFVIDLASLNKDLN